MSLEDIGIDPKGDAGSKKAPLNLLPSFPLHEAAWVLKHGADKYGPYNWRGAKVKASTYRAAMSRHLDQWFDMLEDADEETGRSHLAHVISSAIIVLDAMKHGTLADDRPRGPRPVGLYDAADAFPASVLDTVGVEPKAIELPRTIPETIADLDEMAGGTHKDPFAGLPPLPDPPAGTKWERIPDEEHSDYAHAAGSMWLHSSSDAGSVRQWTYNLGPICPAPDIVYIRPVPII